MRCERVSINADAPRRSLEDRWLPGHVTGNAGGHVWGMGGFGHGRVAGGEQVDGRQQGIAFDGTVQQEGLAGLAVAQLQGRRRRDALLCRFRRLGTDDGIGALAVETTCMAGVRSG
jgi:hypothetical protein